MTDKTVRVRLEAQTAAYQNAMRASARDTHQLSRAVDGIKVDQLGRSFLSSTPLIGRAGTSMLATGGAATAAGTAFAVLGDQLIKGGQAAGEQRAAMGALEAVLGGVSTETRQFVVDAEDLGLSQTIAAQQTAMLAGQLKNLGFEAGVAGDKARDIIERSADMSVGFGSTAQAVNAVSAVLRGEFDTIERFAVGIKQSDVNARLAAQGLDGLTGEALKNAQAVAALELVYEQTEDRAGQWRSESNRLAREQQELGAQLENLRAKIGQGVVPAMTDLVAGLNSAIDTGEALAGVVGELAETAAQPIQFVVEIITPGGGGAGGLFDAFTSAFGLGDIGSALSDLIPTPGRNDELQAVLDDYAESAYDTATAIDGISAALDAVDTMFDRTSGSIDSVTRSAEQLENTVGVMLDMHDALTAVDDVQQSVAAAEADHAASLRDLAAASEDVRDAQLDVASVMARVVDETEAARRGITDYADAQRAAVDPLFAMIRALERQDELLEQSRQGPRLIRDGGTVRIDQPEVPSTLDLVEGGLDVQQAAIRLAGGIRTGDVSLDDARRSILQIGQQAQISEPQLASLIASLEAAAAQAVEMQGAQVDGAAAAEIAAEQFEAEQERAEDLQAAQERLQDAQERLRDAQIDVAETASDVHDAHADATRAALDLEVAAADLNAAIAENPQLLRESLAQLAVWRADGLLTEQQADRMRDSFLEAWNAARELAGTYEVRLSMTADIQAAFDTAQINDLPLYVAERVIGNLNQFRDEWLEAFAIAEREGVPIYIAEGARARGGPVGPGRWLVGEEGPEILEVGGSGYVYDAATSRNMLTGGAQVADAGRNGPASITYIDNSTHESRTEMRVDVPPGIVRSERSLIRQLDAAMHLTEER